MLDQTGARRQESMRVSSGMDRVHNIDRTLRGSIMPNGVFFSDHPNNKSGVTLVNISLIGGYPDIFYVPIMYSKINNKNGEEWTPDTGDSVLVTFINGNFSEPVVIGYLPLIENEIEAKMADAPAGERRYHFRCNKTDIKIDKEGKRYSTVEKDDSLTVKGKRTTIINDNDETTVTSGDIKITVSGGKCTVDISGKTAWKSSGKIEFDGGSGAPMGVVQGNCICPLIKAPHIHISQTVKASL